MTPSVIHVGPHPEPLALLAGRKRNGLPHAATLTGQRSLYASSRTIAKELGQLRFGDVEGATPLPSSWCQNRLYFFTPGFTAACWAA